MSDIPFHLTAMGRQFFERTMPELVRELVRLNANLERLAAATERVPPPAGPSAPNTTADGR